MIRRSSSTKDEAAIRTLAKRFVTAFNARDVEGIMSCYVPGKDLFVFDVIPPRQFVGAEAYRQVWENFMDGFTGTVEMSDFGVIANGNLAYGHNIQHVSGRDRNGSKIDFTLRTTNVYHKIKGRWLIIHEHYSVPVDLGTGKADLASQP